MANVNKVLLIGRLTRDPEIRTFSNGGKVAAFGFAVTNRKKNQETGLWEDDPMFIDTKVYSRGEGSRQVELVEQSLRKGHQVFLEGHLVLEKWDDKKTGEKRSKLVLVVDNFQFLEPRAEGMGGGGGEGGMTRAPRPVASTSSRAPAAPANTGNNGGKFYEEGLPEDVPPGAGGEGNDDEIPF